MPRVPIDPRTLRPIQPKMKKRRIGWIVAAAVVVIIAAGFAINYITYANRMQTYDLYLKSPDFCQEVADSFAAKADSEDAIQIAAYTNLASYELGTGNQVDVMHSGGAEKDLSSFDDYKKFFDTKATSNIKKTFRTSIAKIILFQRDSANDLYTVEFVEETNEIGFNMILVYVSKPLGDLQAARDYFGNKGDKVYQMMSDHWYYVQDLGV